MYYVTCTNYSWTLYHIDTAKIGKCVTSEYLLLKSPLHKHTFAVCKHLVCSHTLKKRLSVLEC